MTFPTVEAVNTTFESSNVTSHDIGTTALSVVNGDLVVCVFIVDAVPAISAWPAGWTQIDLTSDANSQVTVEVRYLRATGAVSDFALTTDSSQNSVHRLYRISGHHASSNPVANATGAASAGTSHNPPSVTFSETGDNLIIVYAGGDNGNANYTGWPETSRQIDFTSGGSAGVVCGSCDAEVNGSSYDPGAFTYDTSEEYVTGTIAIPPAAAATTLVGGLNLLGVGT
jgi:hypothetical protein